MEPEYQRDGGIWNLEKKRLLIDTIINAFDVPKLYLHKYREPQDVEGVNVDFAVIDGKQRLQTIWDFIQGSFALDSSFVYLRDEHIDLSGLKYSDISKKYPDIKADFDSFPLEAVTIETDDIEIIEDLFSRLNEAVPLNAAEKRNAKPGPVPKIVRDMCKLDFFTKKIPFGNNRYRHLDIAAKLLLLSEKGRITDLKKAYIDGFFDRYKDSQRADLQPAIDFSTDVLSSLSGVFEDKDPLLKTVGMITLYYVLFAEMTRQGMAIDINRQSFEQFEEHRIKNRLVAQEDISEAEYALLEFDRFAQSPNDGIALRYRLAVLDKYILNSELGFAVNLLTEDETP